jgi:hypothetical protein
MTDVDEKTYLEVNQTLNLFMQTYIGIDVYNMPRSTKNLTHSHFFHKHILNFYKIPFFDDSFTKKIITKWLVELEAYFLSNKISSYHNKEFTGYILILKKIDGMIF